MNTKETAAGFTEPSIIFRVGLGVALLWRMPRK